MPKREFNTDIALAGGELVTMGKIREMAAAYQLALADYVGSIKLSSANYYNCEFPPLDHDLPDECLVLRYVLHTF